MADYMHILRNPYGHNADEVRAARLWAANEVERLQRIIDSRPAINAGLPQTYIDWSRGIYQCDALQAKGPTNG